MKDKKSAFTLAEILIALGVIAILSAILLPIIHHVAPSKEVVMAKRAYYTASTVIHEMVNNRACYPDKSQETGAARRLGLEDGYGYENCYWGRDVAKNSIDTEGNAGAKFSTLFMEKLGYTSNTGALDQTSFYTTKSGMSWKVLQNGKKIMVDKEVFNAAQCGTAFSQKIDQINFPTGPCPSSCTTTIPASTTTSVNSSCVTNCQNTQTVSYVESGCTNQTVSYVDSTCKNQTVSYVDSTCKNQTVSYVDSTCKNQTVSYVDSTCKSQCEGTCVNPRVGNKIPDFNACCLTFARNANYAGARNISNPANITGDIISWCTFEHANNCYEKLCDSYKSAATCTSECTKTRAKTDSECTKTRYKTDAECTKTRYKTDSECTKTRNKTTAECTKYRAKTSTECTPGCTTTTTIPASSTTDQTCCNNAKIAELNSKRQQAKDNYIGCCSSPDKAAKLACCNSISDSSIKSACTPSVNGAFSMTQEEGWEDDKFLSVIVDIDGTDKGDNCFAKTCGSGKTPDRFTLFVNYDGKITVNPEDAWLAKRIKINQKLTKF